MDRLRLADLRPPVARVLNECTTSTRVRDVLNEAHRRLVRKGRWYGTIQRYQICVSNTGCLTWPRAIETIEGYWLCKCAGIIRNGWYETSLAGPGLLDDANCTNTLLDRGTSATFNDIDNNHSLVQVVSDVAESAGKRILIRGYDENNNWVRTQDSGVWIDGEYVQITNANRFTANNFFKITEVIKDSTNGAVRLWQYDTTLGTATKQLAYYEPDETVPIYRNSLIPALAHQTHDSSSDCESTTLTVIAKLRHIDVVNDNDFFLLGNMAALKLMSQAILKEERNLPDEATFYEAKAVKELQDELSSYEGDGQVPTIKMEGSNTWGGNVLNPVSFGFRTHY
jgi:hypothetical protein